MLKKLKYRMNSILMAYEICQGHYILCPKTVHFSPQNESNWMNTSKIQFLKYLSRTHFLEHALRVPHLMQIRYPIPGIDPGSTQSGGPGF